MKRPPAITPRSPSWWTISGPALLDMLREVDDGGNPDLVYAEHYANSEHEYPEGDD